MSLMTVHVVLRISSIFSSKSEASASKLLVNLEVMFRRLVIVVRLLYRCFHNTSLVLEGLIKKVI